MSRVSALERARKNSNEIHVVELLLLNYKPFYWFSLARSCGSAVPAPVLTSSSTMLVKFHSDETEARSGFRATFVFIHVAGKEHEEWVGNDTAILMCIRYDTVL